MNLIGEKIKVISFFKELAWSFVCTVSLAVYTGSFLAVVYLAFKWMTGL